jgi:hypothetical protein
MKPTSSVAGILKPDGGFRVVVTELRRLRHHVQPGERLFVVPGLKVREPIPWGQKQADVIRAAQIHVIKSLAPANPCGECRQCCKTLYINEDGLRKPSHEWCRHADSEVGCMVYWKRPKPCREFACLWLKSQVTDAPQPLELRPDRTHVVLTSDTSASIGQPVDPELIEVHIDREHPEAAEQEPLASFLAGKKTKGITFYYGEAA